MRRDEVPTRRTQKSLGARKSLRGRGALFLHGALASCRLENARRLEVVYDFMNHCSLAGRLKPTSSTSAVLSMLAKRQQTGGWHWTRCTPWFSMRQAKSGSTQQTSCGAKYKHLTVHAPVLLRLSPAANVSMRPGTFGFGRFFVGCGVVRFWVNVLLASSPGVSWPLECPLQRDQPSMECPHPEKAESPAECPCTPLPEISESATTACGEVSAIACPNTAG